jgi:hypothetical protein
MEAIMFFFARCAFWLGVVAWQLPWPPLADDVEPPAAVAQAPQILGQALGSTCLAHPGRCLAIAKDALSPTANSAASAKVAVTKPAPLTFTAVPARAKAPTHSADSLTRTDLQPPWLEPRG